MIKILITFLTTVFAATAGAQPGTPIRELSVGDQMPDLYINGISNHPRSGAQLSELQGGKLLIIKFWATYCGTCLGAMPKMDSLQRQFKDSLQVIAVTQEPQAAIERLRQRLPWVQAVALPFVAGDTLLYRYFTHRSVPHNVWISPEGRVLAITSHQEVTAAHIRSYLRRENISLRTKRDNMNFHWSKPYQAPDSLVVFKSSLYRYDQSIGGGLAKTPFHFFSDSVQRFLSWNNNLLKLYYNAYSRLNGSNTVNYNRVHLRTKDSSRFVRPLHLPPKYATLYDWKKDNLYTYELAFSRPVPSDSFFIFMLQDLNRLSGVKGTVEKRKTWCWVLTKAKGRRSLVPSKLDQLKIESKGDTLVKVNGVKMDWLTFYLNSFSEIDPVVNLTGIAYPVDVLLNLKIGDRTKIDMTALQKVLVAQGLQLKRKKYPFEVLVLTD